MFKGQFPGFDWNNFHSNVTICNFEKKKNIFTVFGLVQYCVLDFPLLFDYFVFVCLVHFMEHIVWCMYFVEVHDVLSSIPASSSSALAFETDLKDEIHLSERTYPPATHELGSVYASMRKHKSVFGEGNASLFRSSTKIQDLQRLDLTKQRPRGRVRLHWMLKRFYFHTDTLLCFSKHAQEGAEITFRNKRKELHSCFGKVSRLLLNYCWLERLQLTFR